MYIGLTIGGNRPVLNTDQVLPEVARSFNVSVESMQIMLFHLEDFLLMLHDWGVVQRVYNGCLPFHGPGFILFFKRWTRFGQANAAVMPDFVEGASWSSGPCVGVSHRAANAWKFLLGAIPAS